MGTATLLKPSKAYSEVGTLMSGFSLGDNQKTISNLKKVISITTDKKSVSNSTKLLSALIELKNNLPTKGEVDLKLIQKELKNINDSIVKINEIFDVIKNLFDGDNDVKIDDSNMVTLLSNFTESKEIMSFVSDYLKLIIDVQKSIKSLKIYTYEELDSILNIA
jgi:flagellar motor component MotA